MKAEVRNLGPTRGFPTCLGNIFISAQECRPIDNAKAIRELSEYPFLEIKITEPDPPAITEFSAENLKRFRINELRRIAANKGLFGLSRRTKADLIRAMEAL